MKKDYGILAGLLLIGAIVWYFFHHSNLGQSGGAVVSTTASPQIATDLSGGGYPNSQPIKMGDITIGGSPLNLTYNYPAPQTPAVTTATTGNKCDGCGKKNSCSDYKGTTPTTNLSVSANSLQSLHDNYQGLIQKYSS